MFFSSFLLFREQRWGFVLQIITYFSLKHKLQCLVELLYGFAREIIFHEISHAGLFSLSFQTCLLSLVEVFLL